MVVPHFLISRFFAAFALSLCLLLALAFDQPCAAGAALRSCLLAVGQLLIAFWLLAVGFLALCALLWLFCGWAVAYHCAASAALNKSMAVGHPFKGRGSRLVRGNPVGVPRP